MGDVGWDNVSLAWMKGAPGLYMRDVKLLLWEVGYSSYPAVASEGLMLSYCLPKFGSFFAHSFSGLPTHIS